MWKKYLSIKQCFLTLQVPSYKYQFALFSLVRIFKHGLQHLKSLILIKKGNKHKDVLSN